MSRKEATARIKINRLLEQAGWRFFPEGDEPANIELEPTVKASRKVLEALGDNFQGSKRGSIDFLLLDRRGRPLIVLEAKSEDKDPLVGKEQARRYARNQNCRFVLLSNGNLHYFWDLERGNPYLITAFPTADSVGVYQKVTPNPKRLVEETVGSDYIALTSRPNYSSEAGWRNEAERPRYIRENRLCFLRPYQLQAIHALQKAVEEGKDRFLFEMATGTGKTLTAAAVIKLFLRTLNANRVLFLVDRLELEEQARKALTGLLAADFQTVIYKENRDDWRRAEIVVSTVQSLLVDNKYRHLFSPTDFDLVISDEAHRSIGGNARAVFDYFVGYKLGLTATPKDYLKRYDDKKKTSRDPREFERRLLLDTYRTFGCENSQPTFRYSLLDGVRDGYLVNPTVVDARTDVTTRLLSEQGFVVTFTDEEGEDQEQTFRQREFEKRFYSEATNQLFCKTFLEHALRDPISNEVGKSIIYGVSQKHAGRLAQILNEMAERMFPGVYQSDFAVQVTSLVPDAQQFTIQFANNNLLGTSTVVPGYKTSRARVCVTVGMMTTGYDCTDILNLGLFRPIFSPTDFIQIKGRGTRRHDFTEQLFDEGLKATVKDAHKTTFKLFDFFANCEYFEEDYDYDQVLELPRHGTGDGTKDSRSKGFDYEHLGQDILQSMREQPIGLEGMKIDRQFFERFEDQVKADPTIVEGVQAGEWDRVIDHIHRNLFDRPEEFYNLDKLRRAVAPNLDRRLSLREILQLVFGQIKQFKSKDQMLEEEFDKFLADFRPQEAAAIPAIKHLFKAYVTSGTVRGAIDSGSYTDLSTNPQFTLQDLRAVPERYRKLVPEYVKDYVQLNQFLA
ncbi:MAG TPA: DEAD/DEAH box helicase family protein [Anaerolineae bacterium]|nr:DEAD/DEAH box helicase family protein [Anaerolineae bacterium]